MPGGWARQAGNFATIAPVVPNLEALIPMTVSTHDLDKRMSQLRKEMPKRGMDRHLSLLKDISELPVELQSPALAVPPAQQTGQTILYFPPQIQRGWEYVPRQALIFTPTDVTHLIASIWPEEGPQVTHLQGCDLMVVKVTLILLYGFLEIVAQGDSSPTRLEMEFNTVGWYRVSPPLRQLMKATQVTSGGPAEIITTAPAVLEALEALPIKFSNGVKIYGLLPGEVLEALVFQPGTWERRLFLFRRYITANTLLLLSSNYVVVIQEDLKITHGWIITYLPRNAIAGIQNQPRGLWKELSIQMKRGDQSVDYKLLLSSDSVDAWHEQWTQHGGQWVDLPDKNVKQPG
jgi:hypothetical protein